MKNAVEKYLNQSRIFNFLLYALIFLSITFFVLETEFSGNKALKFGSLIVATIFFVEYVLRIWTATITFSSEKSPRLKYIFSFYGLVDLISFLPVLIIGAATGGVIVRLLRFLHLAQLMKIETVRRAIRHTKLAFKRAKYELMISFVISITFIFLGAVAMYFVEAEVQPKEFGSIPRALWWSMATLTTVGYGDVYPVTALGKIIASFLAIIGIGAVAMPAGILAAAFSKAYEDTKNL